VTEVLVRLPRGTGAAPVAAVARQLLDWVVGWYAERIDPNDPAAPVELPARRFVAAGAPREVPWDTNAGQVTVAMDRLIAALDPTAAIPPARSPRRDPANTGRVQRSASLEVQIVRCVPLPPDPLSVPPPEALDSLGATLTADAGHLMSALVDAVRGGILLREHVGQANVAVGDVVTLGPLGGTAAVAGMLTVPLL
jgi:hypothetical protein